MKNRFAKSRRSHMLLRGLVLPAVLFAVISVLFVQGIQSVSAAASAEQLKSTRQAITRAAVHCYPGEGAYPPSLEYLEAKYGLRIDREKYLVDYQCFASNIMPDITVLGLEPAKDPK